MDELCGYCDICDYKYVIGSDDHDGESGLCWACSTIPKKPANVDSFWIVFGIIINEPTYMLHPTEQDAIDFVLSCERQAHTMLNVAKIDGASYGAMTCGRTMYVGHVRGLVVVE